MSTPLSTCLVQSRTFNDFKQCTQRQTPCRTCPAGFVDSTPYSAKYGVPVGVCVSVSQGKLMGTLPCPVAGSDTGGGEASLKFKRSSK